MDTEIIELIADVREQVLYLQELGVEAFDVSLSERLVNFAGNRSEISNFRSENRNVPVSGISNLRSEISDPGAGTIAVPREIPTFSRPENKTQPSERPAGGSRLSSLPTLSSRKKTVPFFDKYNPRENDPNNDIPFDQVEKREPEVSFAQIEENAVHYGTHRDVEDKGNVSSPIFHASELHPIEQIRAEIGKDCRRCKLCELGRTQVVNSVGNFNADLMFVGEAPGADEDAQGEPFVGKAGQLLTDIIEKGLQMPRKDVFIGNINRCRPPGNRAPEPDESVVCKPFLQREIAVVRPKVIVVLGATAAQNLLETKVPISKLRGQFHDYLGTKVMPTFHPAYLLRDPHKKREVWEDMKMVKSYLATGG